VSVTEPINSLYSALHGRLRALGCRVTGLEVDLERPRLALVRFEVPKGRRQVALVAACQGFAREAHQYGGAVLEWRLLPGRHGFVLFRAAHTRPAGAEVAR
jgi:hypothetical protein